MKYSQIRSMDISNGEGIGVALFVQGCHFHCNNCFNSEKWDFNGGKEWTDKTEEEFLELINKPYIQRVSILGGEPLENCNISYLKNLLFKIPPNKTVWLYSGFTWEEISEVRERERLVILCDVLVDGRYIHELRDINLKFRGSSNQRIIDVKKSLESGEVVLWDI